MAHDPVSIARLRELTGWSPDPSLGRGLARVRQRLDAPLTG
jgi:nucleoside-diphosphate-sugar epimerase